MSVQHHDFVPSLHIVPDPQTQVPFAQSGAFGSFSALHLGSGLPVSGLHGEQGSGSGLMHSPPTHFSHAFLSHVLPQAPQFAMSLLVSVHSPPQLVWPSEQHLPDEQVSPELQHRSPQGSRPSAQQSAVAAPSARRLAEGPQSQAPSASQHLPSTHVWRGSQHRAADPVPQRGPVGKSGSRSSQQMHASSWAVAYAPAPKVRTASW